MHIMDGALSVPAMVGANATAALAVAGAARAIDYERVPRVGAMASVFFLATFVHVNVGPASVHLLLNGLVGLLLGWAALPALAVALFLQSVLFGFGGITALGANVIDMGIPAVAVWIFFSKRCRHADPRRAAAWGALAGGSSVALTCALFAGMLYLSDGEKYSAAVAALILAHVPIMLIEAAVTGAAVGFLRKVRPELLDAPLKISSLGTPSQSLSPGSDGDGEEKKGKESK
jgi:cobalt/nickel transport system permease protein